MKYRLVHKEKNIKNFIEVDVDKKNLKITLTKGKVYSKGESHNTSFTTVENLKIHLSELLKKILITNSQFIIELSAYYSEEEISIISNYNLSNLECFNLAYPTQLFNFEFFINATKLKSLKFEDTSLVNFGILTTLKSLKELSLVRCKFDEITSLKSVSKLKHLEYSFKGLPEIEDFSFLSNYLNLRSLTVRQRPDDNQIDLSNYGHSLYKALDNLFNNSTFNERFVKDKKDFVFFLSTNLFGVKDSNALRKYFPKHDSLVTSLVNGNNLSEEKINTIIKLNFSSDEIIANSLDETDLIESIQNMETNPTVDKIDSIDLSSIIFEFNVEYDKAIHFINENLTSEWKEIAKFEKLR